MTLDAFLEDHAPLVAIDLLPDQRLINVVIGDGQLFGVVVANLPSDVSLTRHGVTLNGTTITTQDGLVFDSQDYTMLGTDAP
jgi:hypothetical protein